MKEEATIYKVRTLLPYKFPLALVADSISLFDP